MFPQKVSLDTYGNTLCILAQNGVNCKQERNYYPFPLKAPSLIKIGVVDCALSDLFIFSR
jgi:hypothetical protein